METPRPRGASDGMASVNDFGVALRNRSRTVTSELARLISETLHPALANRRTGHLRSPPLPVGATIR